MSIETDHYENLKQLLINQFDVPEELIVPGANLFEDLGIDSIDAVDMMVHLREVTGQCIAPQTFKAVRTVQDVLDIVNRMTA